MTAVRAVIYLGFNHPGKHKRGVENVISVQAGALDGVRKYYICFDDRNSVCRWGALVCIGLRHDAGRFIALNRIVERLIRRYGRNRVLLHSHNYLMTVALIRRTDIFTVHDGLLYAKRHRRERPLVLFRWIEQAAYRRSSIGHFNSLFTLRESLWPKSQRPWVVIHCGTPLETLWTERRETVSRSRESEFRILAVRSMEERARIDLLLDVARTLKVRRVAARIVVAGKGPLLERWRAEIEERRLDNIVLLGFVPDRELATLYSEADVVLVVADYGEGFGLPVIEGYLYNKPVVASNRCALPEIICDPSFLVENAAEEIATRAVEAAASGAGWNFREYYDRAFSLAHIQAETRLLYQQASLLLAEIQ